VLPHRLVVTCNSHHGKQLLGDVDLPLAMDALIFAVRYNISLWLGAGEHLFHVAPADLLQRLSRQDMHMPGLGVHGRRRALGDRDDLFDHGARHRLGSETTHTSARVYKLFKIHFGCPWVWPGGGACIKYIEPGIWTLLQLRASSRRAGPPVMPRSLPPQSCLASWFRNRRRRDVRAADWKARPRRG